MKKYERDLHAKEKESEQTRAWEPSRNHEMHKIVSDLKDFIIWSHSLHMDTVWLKAMTGFDCSLDHFLHFLPFMDAELGLVRFLQFLYLTHRELLRALSKHGSKH